MIEGFTRTLREIQDGSVARRVLGDVLRLAQREGILDRVRMLSPFSLEELCGVLRVDAGYVLDKGNRLRMICLLLSLLQECRVVTSADGRWQWGGDASWAAARAAYETPECDDATATADAQYAFFRRCLEGVPAYLRGGDSPMRFDAEYANAWERFLGCEEFRRCREVLLECLGIDGGAVPRILDLCHGPGWDIEAIVSRVPAARITAVDFTDAFREAALERAARAQERTRRAGQSAPPVLWVGRDDWKGFGRALPFPDRAFDVVFFSCGDPYIPAHLRQDVYRDVARVLVAGGRLGILTRCRPDAALRHVPSFWLRVAALVHDFAESVCEGWEGFPNAEDNVRMFSQLGFHGGMAIPNSMSVLESSLWVLKKVRADA
jgi:SAM-dependent methyltransferase